MSTAPKHGQAQALKAAQLYRDSLVEAHPPLSKPDYCAILKRNNRYKGRLRRRLYWEAQ